MSKLPPPSILCAIHCMLMPVFYALVGGVSATHCHHGETGRHTVHWLEWFLVGVEYPLIGFALFFLLRTTIRMHEREVMKLTGIALAAMLVVTLLLLSHEWMIGTMLLIAAYQWHAKRMTCRTAHAH